MSGYRSLNVYEKSYKAAIAVYEMTRRFPKEEQYAMTDQIRRAAMSIPLNIAEGYGKKRSQQEFNRFLRMGAGSSNEVQVLLDFAKDLGYIATEQYEKARETYEEISRMLAGMMKRVESEI